MVPSMVSAPTSSTRRPITRSTTDDAVITRAPKPVVKKPTTSSTPSTADAAAPTGVASRTAAAPARKPTVDSSTTARAAHLFSPVAGSMRARLERETGATGAAGRSPLVAGDAALRDGTAPGTTGASRAPSSRRLSVDDPIARFAATRDAQGRPGALAGSRTVAGDVRAPADGDPSTRRGGDEEGGFLSKIVGKVVDSLPKPEGFHENSDGTHTFHGNGGDDRYQVSRADDGGLTVTNGTSGETYSISAEDAAEGVTIRGWSGNDRITVDEDVSTPITIEGGSGDDRIDASGANGSVQLDGGSGDDRLTGSDARDVITGGTGDDRIDGGSGDDQLRGQDGDDRVLGSDGHDYVQGGDGADHLDAGTGGDIVYGDALDSNIGVGKDGDVDVVVTEDGSVPVKDVSGGDSVHTFDPEAVDAYLEDHPELVIDGSEDFVDRTRADLGVLLGTEQGRGLLDELTAKLEDEGEELTFREKPRDPLHEAAGGGYLDNEITIGQFAETYSDGSNRHPLPALFHELVHAYQDNVGDWPEGGSNFEGGTTVPNVERQATGLPYIDEDGNLHPANELKYTDNRLREELGLPQRTTYGGESGDPQSYNEEPHGDGEGDGHDHGRRAA